MLTEMSEVTMKMKILFPCTLKTVHYRVYKCTVILFCMFLWEEPIGKVACPNLTMMLKGWQRYTWNYPSVTKCLILGAAGISGVAPQTPSEEGPSRATCRYRAG